MGIFTPSAAADTFPGNTYNFVFNGFNRNIPVGNKDQGAKQHGYSQRKANSKTTDIIHRNKRKRFFN